MASRPKNFKLIRYRLAQTCSPCATNEIGCSPLLGAAGFVVAHVEKARSANSG